GAAASSLAGASRGLTPSRGRANRSAPARAAPGGELTAGRNPSRGRMAVTASALSGSAAREAPSTMSTWLTVCAPIVQPARAPAWTSCRPSQTPPPPPPRRRPSLDVPQPLQELPHLLLVVAGERDPITRSADARRAAHPVGGQVVRPECLLEHATVQVVGQRDAEEVHGGGENVGEARRIEHLAAAERPAGGDQDAVWRVRPADRLQSRARYFAHEAVEGEAPVMPRRGPPDQVGGVGAVRAPRGPLRP